MAKAPPPPLPPRCDGCGGKHPSFGLKPPLAPRQQWFCGRCIHFQPDTQARLAQAAIDALDGDLS